MRTLIAILLTLPILLFGCFLTFLSIDQLVTSPGLVNAFASIFWPIATLSFIATLLKE